MQMIAVIPSIFVGKVEIKDTDCWLWIASTSYDYGHIWYKGRYEYAHRVSWEIHKGPIPKGLYVLHNCPNVDNKLCVNPDHLWLGTNSDNMKDMYKKGVRSQRCGSNSNATLQIEYVEFLKEMYASGHYTQQILSQAFGISQKQVSLIVRGKAWV